jgi:4-amino-4-deoxy-L-arabinose transferase-like glycosyltransferase
VNRRPGSGAWVLLALVLVAAAAVRLRLLEAPLDRDEGEYAYFGQLLLQGIPPYATAYHAKLPGVYGAYALALALFGRSVAGIHLGLLVVNAATSVLVFLVAARLFNRTVAVSAAAVFAILSLSPRLQGLAAYAEHFLLLPALAGALVLLRAVESRRLLAFFASGALVGVAFIIKQSGGAFVLFAVLYTLLAPGPAAERDDWRRRSWPALAVVAGALVPFAVVCAGFIAAGLFDRFWFWTVVYTSHYASTTPLSVGLLLLTLTARSILSSSYLVVVPAAVGVSALLWDPRAHAGRLFVLLLSVCALAGASVGLYFRNQYFLLLTPAGALLAGLGAEALATRVARAPALRHALCAALIVVPLGHFAWAERAILFETQPADLARALAPPRNPLPESLEIGRWIRAHSAPTDRIAVIGSEPQIYFYAGLRAATGYIYMYPLMENQPYAAEMQRRMIGEIEAAQPRFVVLVNVAVSWNVGRMSDRTVFQWWGRYQEGFERVGIADIMDRGTRYVWGPDAEDYTPTSPVWVAVFERKA